MIEAIFFDFDGIIVDSERLHWTAFNTVLNPYNKNLSWSEYVQIYIGFDDRDAFKHALPNLEKAELVDLIDKKAAVFQELASNNGAAALPGAVDLINHLSGKLPLAICSGALLEDILPIIGKLGVENAFNTLVTANDTPVSKPNPAPYQLAMKRLGVTSGMAIEDTPAGIASAKGAGLKVLSVTNSYAAEFLTQADAIVDSLEGLTLPQLNQMIYPAGKSL